MIVGRNFEQLDGAATWLYRRPVIGQAAKANVIRQQGIGRRMRCTGRIHCSMSLFQGEGHDLPGKRTPRLAMAEQGG